MTSQERYDLWLSEPSLDAQTRAELNGLKDDPHEIEERFYRDLEFGTAGLRGILGAGNNRMNRYTVRRAAQGLADYIISVDPGGRQRGVCIAYDTRLRSDEFARETACSLAANGIQSYLFSTPHSVPQLSFALQHLGCIAGVVVTASHNPKQYNGFKVYWAYGGQAAPEQAEAIYARIEKAPLFTTPVADFDKAISSGLITLVGQEEDEAYYAATEKLLLDPARMRTSGDQLNAIYTPLHGTGAAPVMTLLRRVGVSNVSMVPEQAVLDGAFPTVSAPNPEDPNAFSLAIQLAEKTGASLCFATDPDADRLGVAVKTADGAWQTLTGNQIGCLLLEHILSTMQKNHTLPKNGVVIKSLVSTRLADAICARYGVEMENVPTGFRYIGEKVDEYQRTGQKTFLFGFEESFGFLAGGLARDKDAICAAMFVSEAALEAAASGKTLSDMLDALYQSYGFYREKAASYTLEGKAGMKKIASCMRALRKNPLSAIAGDEVTLFEDYLSGKIVSADESAANRSLPKSDMLRFLTKSGAWVVVRPSGTEPKLKLYVGANASSPAALAAALDARFSDVDTRLKSELS